MTETGKIALATALSVLAHVILFTVLALVPDASLVPTPDPAGNTPAAISKETPTDPRPLEVTLETATPVSTPPPALIEPTPADIRALHTQLDPENLRKTDEAPENAAHIAAHNSKAAPGSASSPTAAPSPTPGATGLAIQPAKTAATPGEIGIDALGNYGKAVGNAIGVRWNTHRRIIPLSIGEVRVQFILDAQGRPSQITILTNTAGALNAAIARKAVEEARIPPIPPDRLAHLPGRRIQIVYSFTIYPSK